MCKTLNINYGILAKRNYKKLLVEKFHRFINNIITIAVEDSIMNDVSVAVNITAGYIWNSFPIDETDILCSVPTV